MFPNHAGVYQKLTDIIGFDVFEVLREDFGAQPVVRNRALVGLVKCKVTFSKSSLEYDEWGV